MAAADTSKSLVHIQERFVKRAIISPVTVAVPTIGTADTVKSVTLTNLGVTNVKAGDIVFATPTAADQIVTNAVPTAAVSLADGTVSITFQAVGGPVTGASKTYALTIFAPTF